MFDRTGLSTSSACFEHCGQLDITDAGFAAHWCDRDHEHEMGKKSTKAYGCASVDHK